MMKNIVKKLVRSLFQEEISWKDFKKVSGFMLKFCFKNSSVLSILLAFITVMFGVLNAGVAYATKVVIDSSALYINGEYAHLQKAFLCLTAIIVIQVLMKCMDTLCVAVSIRAGMKMSVNFNDMIYEKMGNLSAVSYDSPELKAELKTYSMGAAIINDFINWTANAVRLIVRMISSLAIVFTISPWIGLISVASIPISLYTIIHYRKTYGDFWTQENFYSALRDNNANVFFQKETLAETKVFGNSAFFNEQKMKYAEKIDEIRKLSASKSNLKDRLFEVLAIILELMAYLILLFKIVNGTGTLGDFTLLQGARQNFSQTNNTVSQISVVLYCIQSYGKIIDLLETSEWAESEPEDVVPLERVTEIRLDNVSFKYPNAERYALENVSFEIREKEYVAFVGVNGSGKSTLLKLIAGLYSPTSGTIYYNGIPHTRLRMKDIRRSMAMVMQDYNKYALSFCGNAAFEETVGEDEKIRLTQIAEKLGLYGVIGQYENGWNTMLMNNIYTDAVNLSEGQWQKLAAVRGLYKTGSVLLMDEPSSALDAEAESVFYDTVKAEEGYSLKIMVSHRLASMKDTDKIVVLEDGRIVEIGSHRELFGKNTMYSKLYSIQAERYA